jgi:hypothetical protein
MVNPTALPSPDRPALAKACATLVGIDDIAHAFERLTTNDVLPASFVGDVTRAFWCRGCAGHGRLIATSDFAGGECPWCRGNLGLPSRFEDLLAWASLGGDGIARAEHLVRTAAERLRPWGVRPPVETATTPDGHTVTHERPWRVVWRIADPEKACGTTVPPKGWGRSVGRREDRMSEAWHRVHDDTVRSFSEPQHDSLAWGIAITAGYCAVWGDPRPNPYEPLRDLYALGLVLLAIEDDALMLVCPPIIKDDVLMRLPTAPPPT